jgi:serine/threonine protein kinase
MEIFPGYKLTFVDRKGDGAYAYVYSALLTVKDVPWKEQVAVKCLVLDKTNPYLVCDFRDTNETSINEFDKQVGIHRIGSDEKFAPELIIACVHNGMGFIVTELFEGDLEDRNCTPPLEKEIRRLISVMHKAGVFHHDLFPKNILFKRNESKVKLAITDFGLSVVLPREVDDYMKQFDLFTCFYGYFHNKMQFKGLHRSKKLNVVDYYQSSLSWINSKLMTLNDCVWLDDRDLRHLLRTSTSAF